jgi:hydroxyethylthiazole kinase-like uncharacterized protein yjeF
MKILSAEQMRDADRLTTERYGIPSLELMENAGCGVLSYLVSAYPDLRSKRIVILCGKGNNGGDGLAVARLLRQSGVSAVVLLFAEPSAMRGDAAAQLKAWQQSNGELHVVTSDSQWEQARELVAAAEIIVDALLGTGLTGPVEGLLAKVIESVNESSGNQRKGGRAARARVVSVDMPSGLASGAHDFGGPVVAAQATVTFTAPKLGQLVSARADHVGKLVVHQIGTPSELLDDDPQLKLYWIESREFRELPLVRSRDANKGRFGHALIIAGSVGKSGAAALSGRAALRVGAGLVTVATPAGALPTVAASMAELMTVPLAATEAGTASMGNLDYGRFAELVHGKTVLAIGPGVSTDDQTQQYVRSVVAQADMPVILDADGLNAFVGRTGDFTSRKTEFLAMTPHPGEMARLLNVGVPEVQSRRLEVALETASRWRAYVVLKGFNTILATPDGRAFINSTGNPGMATGGTGDVLTGMLAGLTAEFGTAHWERVLALGVHLHGLAGDVAAARVGEIPLVASDVTEALPQAFGQLLAQWETA